MNTEKKLEPQFDKREKEPSLHDGFLQAAKMVLQGELPDIHVRQGVSNLKLFIADRLLSYKGYTPEQEYLKGLICQETEAGELEVIAPCLTKFYNLGEKPELDRRFYHMLTQSDVAMHLPEKMDGTNVRFYFVQDTGEIKVATRGILEGGKDEDENGLNGGAMIHFGEESLKIAADKFPKLLDPKLLDRYTPVFELIHPQNRIVTDYGDRTDLVLLSVFDKQNGCRELTRQELKEFSRQHELNLVKTFEVKNNKIEDILEELRTSWLGTDQEGVVITLEQNNEIAFRLKVKGKDYLKLMYKMSQCSFNNTLKFLAEMNIADCAWSEFRQYLIDKFQDLPEEILMAYEKYFQVLQDYEAMINKQMEDIITAYKDYMSTAPSFANQKEFALAIASRPDKAFFFLLNKFGDDSKTRTNIIEQLKKNQPIKKYAREKLQEEIE